ncbi:MAG: ABC transporter permease [Bacilli bacterium]|jgi:simple sugar transport system permease protein|nr:ABC transporter permease [Bacilli bacterium]
MAASLIGWITTAIVYGTILAIAACGESLNEKVGHLNLGVPGIMYLAGVLSFGAVSAYESTPNPNGFLDAVIGIGVALAVGAVLGLLYSLFCATFKANQNVMGLAISAFGTGFGMFFSTIFDGKPKLAMAGANFNAGIPGLKSIPVVGPLFFGYGFMTYVTLAILILTALFLNKTRAGLNLRAVGESPAGADAVGINVLKYKYLTTTVGCSLCGLAGLVYVFQYSGGTWSTNNNIEALGWLAIALVIFALWRPRHLIWAAPLFGFLFWAYNFLPGLIPNMGFVGMTEIFQMLPYLVTIIVLIVSSLKKKKENQPPESLGLNYFREDR